MIWTRNSACVVLMMDSEMSTYLLELPETFSNSAVNRDWKSVKLCISNVTKQLSNADRRKVTIETLNQIAYVLHVASKVQLRDKSGDVIIAITECFTFLTKACDLDNNVQNNIVNTSVFNNTSDILNNFSDYATCDKNLVCVIEIVQFLGHSVAKNQRNQNIVWEFLSPHLKKLLSHDDSALVNFTCMVLNNILIGESDAALTFTIDNIAVLLQNYSNGSEFAMFVVQYILAKENLLEDIYPMLETESRLQILDLIWIKVNEEENNRAKLKIPLPSILFLVDQLKHLTDFMLTILEEGVNAEPRETLSLLDVVACASSRSEFITTLQADSSLLISIARLLKNVNEIRKADGSNIFSSVPRFSEMKFDNDFDQDNPVFDFKVSMVQLIGNLCHQHVHNQNQVRKLGCLPAVLDSCNIDIHEPLLLQWGVVAVGNLLENNVANQQIVAALVAQSPASNMALEELGLELHQDAGGMFRIGPMRHTSI